MGSLKPNPEVCGFEAEFLYPKFAGSHLIGLPLSHRKGKKKWENLGAKSSCDVLSLSSPPPKKKCDFRTHTYENHPTFQKHPTSQTKYTYQCTDIFSRTINQLFLQSGRAPVTRYFSRGQNNSTKTGGRKKNELPSYP